MLIVIRVLFLHVLVGCFLVRQRNQGPRHVCVIVGLPRHPRVVVVGFVDWLVILLFAGGFVLALVPLERWPVVLA